MRGKLGKAIAFQSDVRITPAHAGKTCSPAAPAARSQDHPRACGENQSGYSASTSSAGSPPRMRGKLPHEDIDALAVRITPAHAGKTPSAADILFRREDHPRACGENTSEMAYFRS